MFIPEFLSSSCSRFVQIGSCSCCLLTFPGLLAAFTLLQILVFISLRLIERIKTINIAKSDVKCIL